MSDYLAKVKVNIRSHAKFHKTRSALIFNEARGDWVCCVSVGEAEVMAYAGVDNILIVNEVVGEVAIRRAANLACQAGIILIIDDMANVQMLHPRRGNMA